MIAEQHPYPEWTLVDLLESRVKDDPDGIFAKLPNSETTYELGFRPLTNVEVLRAVDKVAFFLKDKTEISEDFQTVAFIAPSAIYYAIMLLAGIKVGIKTFFPSPRNSKAAFESLFNRLDCHLLVTTTPEPPSVSKMTEDFKMQKITLPSLKDLFATVDSREYRYLKSFQEARDDPVLVLHTSGSTGIPKPLIYTNQFILNTAIDASLDPPEGFRSLDVYLRSGHFFSAMPPFHIAGVFLSIVFVLHFKTIPVYPISGIPPSPQGLIAATDQTKIDWAFLAPSMLEELSRDQESLAQIASRVDYVFYSGGALSAQAGGAITTHMNLFQVYGSSEMGMWPLIQPESDKVGDDWAYVQTHPFVNVEFQHRFGDLYELVVVRKTDGSPLQPVFLLFPELNQYGTRDLFRAHPTRPNAWIHQSRIDDIIVFSNGEKTNPISFEQELSQHPEVRSALVAGAQKFEASLLIELLDTKPLSAEAQDKVIDKIWPSIEKANLETPAHAQVSKSKVLIVDPAMPMLRAAKGTVQRQATWNLYAEKLQSLYEKDEQVVSHSGQPGQESRLQDEQWIAQQVRKMAVQLTACSDLGDDELFFSRGMDSLGALRLSRALRDKFGSYTIGLRTIYDYATVNSLAKHIHDSSTSNSTISAPSTSQDREKSMASMLKAYEDQITTLVSSKSINASVTEPTRGTSAGKVVVLTGSTGAIGSHLLHELLQQESVTHVYCFNRSVDSLAVQLQRSQEQGLPANFDPTRVTFLTTDLSVPDFTLKETRVLEEIYASVTHIIHNAWPVDFNLPLVAFKPHLDGVINLLSLAISSHRSASILFISSISSMMRYATADRPKDHIPEEIVPNFACPDVTGYGESKYLSERILDYASRHLRVKTGSVRIGQVAGSSEGKSHWNRNEWLPSLVISSRYISALPASLGMTSAKYPEGPYGTIDWLPINELRKPLVELSFGQPQDDATGTSIYHVKNPKVVTWASLLPTIRQSLSTGSQDIQVVPYDQWLALLEEKSYTPNASDGSEFDGTMFWKNPGIKLLDFYQRMGKEAQGSANFDIRRTLKASKAMGNMRAITPDRMAAWIEDWMIGL